jgi:hypothetical protein
VVDVALLDITIVILPSRIKHLWQESAVDAKAKTLQVRRTLNDLLDVENMTRKDIVGVKTEEPTQLMIQVLHFLKSRHLKNLSWSSQAAAILPDDDRAHYETG